MVLPGETLAKYGKEKQQSRGKSEAQPEHQAAERAAEHSPEHQERGFLQDAESAGPIPAKFEQEDRTEARVEAPRVFHRRESAPVIEEHEARKLKLLKRLRHLKNLKSLRLKRKNNGLKG